MKMYKRLAKQISYAPVKRKKKIVKTIYIHGTGNKGDTAKNNADFYATGNERIAGAHFFIDRDGKIARSIPMNRIAYAVGDMNNNTYSVSIELCDIYNKYPSKKQIKATRKLIKYIKRYCKNVKHIKRHYDSNGKLCPNIMCGNKQKDKVWKQFLIDIGYNKGVM